MSKIFPRWKYHETEKPKVVRDEHEEKHLGEKWKDSPADHGIETHPGCNNLEHRDFWKTSIAQLPVTIEQANPPKKRGRPPKVAS